MLSLLPVLVHDPDLPAGARAALHRAQAAANGPCHEVAKHRAAASLSGLFGLDDREIADLIGLDAGPPLLAATPTPC